MSIGHAFRPWQIAGKTYAFRMQWNPDISYFGRSNGRQPHRTFGIWQKDRLSHFYVIGRTGTGKSNLLESLALQDILRGRGVCVIDPHGDLTERLLRSVPEHRRADLIYLNAADPNQPYSYNPLGKVSKDQIPLAASGLLEAFKKLWQHEWGVRMEHVLRNALYALLSSGNGSLPNVLQILTDKTFRVDVLTRVDNEQVKEFWEHEYANYFPPYRQQAIAPIQNKVGAFLADPRLKRLFSGEGQELHIRQIMDERKILLINLSKGILGEDSANLLGALLVTAIGLAGLSRGDVPEQSRKPFFVYIDEFQSFTTLSVANMVSELRKFGVGLILAHQHLHQLDLDVRHAVLGNVGTIVSFRLGPEDARVLAGEFAPVFSAEDLVNLPNWNVYVKLLIDGAPSRRFSASTLRPDDIYS